MQEYVRVDRTGPSIRAALAAASPDELPDFEAEFHIALAEADDDFDTSRIEQVLTRWWGVAHLRLNLIRQRTMNAASSTNSPQATSVPHGWQNRSVSIESFAIRSEFKHERAPKLSPCSLRT